MEIYTALSTVYSIENSGSKWLKSAINKYNVIFFRFICRIAKVQWKRFHGQTDRWTIIHRGVKILFKMTCKHAMSTFKSNFWRVFCYFAQLCVLSDKKHGSLAIYHLVFDKQRPRSPNPKWNKQRNTYILDNFVDDFKNIFYNFLRIFAHLAQLCLVSDKEHGPSAIYHLVFDDDDRDTRGIQKRFLHAYTSSWLIFWLLYLLLSICLFVHLSLCWDT